MEHLVAVELRALAEGRRLEGVALRYSDEARIGRLRERFTAGGVEVASPAVVNLAHDRARPLGLVVFEDSPEALRFRVDLEDGELQDRALTDVREGRLTGASIEFRALADRVVGGLRTVERAVVFGLALTDRPAYAATAVEAREAMLPAGPDPRRGMELYL